MKKLRAGEKPFVQEPRISEVKEYSLSWEISQTMSEITGRLKDTFPLDYSWLMALAYCRLRYQSPMSDVQADFSDSHLSSQLGAAGLLPGQLSSFLYELGGERSKMVSYMDRNCKGSSNMIFDGTDLISASRLMGLPQHTKTGGFDRAVNMMMAYSLDNQLPAYYRLLPGNIKDVKAFRICMDESGASSAVAILDKTFPSKQNLEFLEKAGIKYIASLRGSTKRLDYNVFENWTNKGLDGHFKYHGRTLWYKELRIDGRRVVMYLDKEHRIENDRDYIERIDSGRFEG